MFSKWGGYKASKVKPALSQAMIRIKLFKNKKTLSIAQSKKSVAAFLKENKVEKARLEAERIVRDDFTIEAYDILELMCELVRDNAKLLEAEKECPYDMVEAVSTILYAADRTEVPELKIPKEQLIKKYGKEFFENAIHNKGGVVNERVLHRLSGQRPNAFLVLNYMKEVAKEQGVDWEPDEVTAEVGQRFDAPMVGPDGSSINPGTASGLGTAAYQVTDGRILQPGHVPVAAAAARAGMNKAVGNQNLNNIGNGLGPAEDSDPLSVDSLAARFNAFKSDIKPAPTSASDMSEQHGQLDNSNADAGVSLDFDIPAAPTHDTNDITQITTNDSNIRKTNISGESDADAATGETDPAVPGYNELLNRFAKLKSES
mmetsp:Transcript_5084/g.6414  ORF Transcript_5084/g.6414 Transcript_5084/m.6414 type:complete len:373 (+) Transcript_5084:167-1285(+)